MSGQAAPGEGSSRQGRLAAYIRLFDPAPVAVVLTAATIYAFVAADGSPPVERLLPFLAALLLTQFAIAFHNHYCDRHLDASARPWRALPRGLVGAGQLHLAAWALFATGVGIALIGADPVVAALVAVGTSAGFAYNAYFKRTPWSWLPYWLALPTLLVCVFAVVGRDEPRLWLSYLVGMPLVLAVHLGDALSESELDAGQGMRGLAQWLGRGRGLLVCWAALLLALALALLLRSGEHPPGPAYPLAAALVAVVMLASFGGGPAARRVHWFAVMATAVALGLGWVADLTGLPR